MIIERRAIHEIQTELNLISQKCNFQGNWTSLCIQFFSHNEQKIPHISPNYKDFALGLLYYVIRHNNKIVNREYFQYSVINKVGTREDIFKIYRKLCEKFETPDPINYKVLWDKIAEFLKSKFDYVIDLNEYDRLIVLNSPEKFSQIRGLNDLFFNAQKIPRRYLLKQLRPCIIRALSEIQLL